MDPVLEPYARLEIPGTLYISSLAVFDEFRGMGPGTEMLSIARDQARERGLDALSLLVFEQNTGAVNSTSARVFGRWTGPQWYPTPLSTTRVTSS